MSTPAAYSKQALKRSAWHFLGGKAVSALLTFLILLWLVRLLSVAEYGVYVTLVASMELAMVIATLGLPWMAARFLPEFRLHAHRSQFRRLVLNILGWQVAALAGLASVLALGLDVFLGWANLQTYHAVAQVYLLILFAEGIGREVRESLLGPLLLQGVAQISLVIRNLVFIALLAAANHAGTISLIDVVQAELVASVVGVLLALVGLAHHLRNADSMPGKPGWQKPRLVAMWRVASHMYLSNLLTMLYSPQAYLLFIQRYLGVEAAAVFGFLRTLYEQISRYLPATLLFSLVRPKLVAAYVGDSGADGLSRNANLAGKLSLFVLMPVVTFIGVAGQDLVSLLSGVKFPDTGLLFFGFMLALIPYSQRQILETVAVASGHSHLCIRAAASGLFMLPLMYGLLVAGLKLWAPVITLGLGYLLFNSMIMVGIVRHTSYRPDIRGFYKLLTAALAGFLAAAFLPAAHPNWVHLIFVTVLVMVVYLLAAWLIKPFSDEERERLNRLFNRKLFIW